MKTMTPLLIFTFFFLFYFINSKAQNQEPSSTIESHYEFPNSIKIGEDVYFTPLNNPEKPTSQSNTTESVTLTFNIETDAIHQGHGIYISVLNEYFNYFDSAENEELSYSVDIVPGTYDIFVQFNGNPFKVVVKELVEISGDMVINIDIDEAIHEIRYDFYDQNGNIIQLPNSETDTKIDGVRAFKLPGGVISQMVGQFNVTDNPRWNYFINEVSDRISSSVALITLGLEDNYCVKFETIAGINSSQTIENDPDNYLIHQEKYQPGAIAQESLRRATGLTLVSGDLVTFHATTTMGILDQEDAQTYYLDIPVNSNDDFNALSYTGIIENEHDSSVNITNKYYQYSPLMSVQNGNIVYGSKAFYPSVSQFRNMEYFFDTQGKTPLLPQHPKFSFNETEFKTFGDNVPIMVTGAANNFLGIKFSSSYYGMYGEKREADLLNTEVEVIKDGVNIFSGDYLEFYDEVMPLSGGEFEVILTNNNIIFNGENVSHTTIVKFDTNLEDALPPTLQRLQLRKNSEVTNTFADFEGAELRLAGGDFTQQNIATGIKVYTYVEGSEIEVQYSINGQDDWNNLDLIKEAEYFQMPGYGDYYSVSLESMESETSKFLQDNDPVSFDLRIKITDESGNSQEQILNKAFYWDPTLSVENFKEDARVIIYPNPVSEMLHIDLPVNLQGDYNLRLVDLKGSVVFAQSGKIRNETLQIDTSSLTKGIYFLEIQNAEQKVIRKIIKE